MYLKFICSDIIAVLAGGRGQWSPKSSKFGQNQSFFGSDGKCLGKIGKFLAVKKIKTTSAGQSFQIQKNGYGTIWRSRFGASLFETSRKV